MAAPSEKRVSRTFRSFWYFWVLSRNRDGTVLKLFTFRSRLALLKYLVVTLLQICWLYKTYGRG